MSCDPGFPDLNATRQRSLCVLLQRVNDRHALSAMLLAAMVADNAFGAGAIKNAEAARKRYEDLAELICLQFHYRRDDRRGTFGPESACKNADLIMAMSQIDSQLALLSGIPYRELRCWLNTGGDTYMPKVMPVFQAEKKPPRSRKPAKASAEK